MENKRLHLLLDRLFSESATAEEKTELMSLLDKPDHDEVVKQYLDAAWGNVPLPQQLNEAQSASMLSAILSRQETPVVPLTTTRNYRTWYRVAAAILILAISAAGYFILDRPGIQAGRAPLAQKSSEPKQDIAPGTSGAILTLANGSTIVLDTAADGNLAQQGNTRIQKNGGTIQYVSKGGELAANAINTISTPRGKKFQLRLDDGTIVWLNAASSIRFPASFDRLSRSVEITGEAYFEVAKDASRPFTVKVNDMQVQVLGTHFNINAYDDEPVVKTTLLEGSVKVNNPVSGKMLVPGQQAQLAAGGGLQVKTGVNTSEVIAWKNDLFSFNNTDVNSLMRQLSRWYDAEIVMPKNIEPVTFNGQISRSANISDVLKILELTEEISFTIQGKKVIVKM
ncbi:MAG: FecR domain-containing protein [Bacteroidota bacterium]